MDIESPEEADRVTKGMIPVASSISFRVLRGKMVDYVVPNIGSLFLISERLAGVLAEHRITGWSSFPVSVSGADTHTMDYLGLVVRGRCGRIDRRLSKRVQLPPRVPGGKSRKAFIGVYFDPESWDGSEIFTPEGIGNMRIFASQRVKEVVESSGVSNIRFDPIAEAENFAPW